MNKSFSKNKRNYTGLTIVISVIVMLVLSVTSCKKDIKDVVVVAFDPEKSYTMKALDVSTLVSDSGITRYRLNTKKWLVFGKASEPHWFFPKGIYVEKFDTLFRTQASIKADTAFFYDRKGLWRLLGHVKVSSLSGEKFETSELFWDQRTQKVYSDKFIRIEQAEKTITGIGFESNQDMTLYKIFKIQGIFLVAPTRTDTINRY